MNKSKPRKSDLQNIPAHIAVIMDGNGRWAKKRRLPRIAGHKVGMESVRALVKGCDSVGVRYLTLYAFSAENWRRPRLEVAFLMKLLEIYLRGEIEELHLNNVRVTSIGKISEIPARAQKELALAKKKTEKNTGLILTLALNYGSRQEILEAASALVRETKTGKRKPGDVSEAEFVRHLSTKDMPDPDLVIRTSGEMRLSNFLMWQAAYAELYVTPVLWPDFRKPHLMKALREYSKRERRFGDIKGPRR